MALDEAIATRTTALRIESLLSARLFLSPQLADDRLYFVSDLAGRLSLYAMDAAGGVPEPLLPPGSPSRIRSWSAATHSSSSPTTVVSS